MPRVNDPGHLFVLARAGRTPLVFHVRLTRELQEGIAQLFDEQASAFKTEDVEPIPFDGNYTADESQIFKLDGYTLPPALEEAFADPQQCAPFQLHAVDDDLHVTALALARATNRAKLRVTFQVFAQSQLIKPSKLALFQFASRDTFEHLEAPGLTLGQQATALFDGEALYFRSFVLTRRFLPLTAYFEEATNQQVTDFLSNALFKVGDPQKIASQADQWTRRKIGLLLAEDVLDTVNPSEIVSLGERVGIDVQTDTVTVRGKAREVIVLPENRRDMKKVLKLLAEDYLASLLSPDRLFEVNSKRQLKAR